LKQKKNPARLSRTKPRKTRTRDKSALVSLVRKRVEKFILEGAPIVELQKAIRIAARSGKHSTHPLTGPVFRRIVLDAIRQRKRSMNKTETDNP
jgi:hypothetical protein